jgi:hypothetical protein
VRAYVRSPAPGRATEKLRQVGNPVGKVPPVVQEPEVGYVVVIDVALRMLAVIARSASCAFLSASLPDDARVVVEVTLVRNPRRITPRRVVSMSDTSTSVSVKPSSPRGRSGLVTGT